MNKLERGNMMEYDYYISFIFAARNDDYCNNFIERFQITLNCLQFLCEKYNLSYEIVIVEWSPLLNKRLRDVLRFDNYNKNVRIITVPSKFNDKIPPSPFDIVDIGVLNFFEYHAKNIGIRQAKGEYILCSNSDIIFSESLIELLSKKKLLKKHFYRAYKYRMKRDIPNGLTYYELLKFCKKKSYVSSRGKGNKGGKGNRGGIFAPGAGDFFLMHRDNYEDVRGYPEIRCDGLGIDDFILYCSSVFLKQFIFEDPPHRVYHQLHQKRWETYDRRHHTIEGNKQMMVKYNRLKNKMKKKKINLNPNGENWGFNDFDFEGETINE